MKYLFFALALLTLPESPMLAQDAKPITFQQIKDMIDWEMMPLLEGALKARPFFNHISYEAPGTYQEVAAFYRQKLPALGWKEDAALVSGDQTGYLSVTFEKDGTRLGLSGYRSKPTDPMTITLMIEGNVDATRFPKLDDAQLKANQKNSVYYLTKKPPEEVASFCKKFMLERGWTEKPHPHAPTWAKEGRIVLQFDQNAIQVTIVSALEKDGTRSVSYTSGVQHEMKSKEVTSTVTNKKQPKPATLKQTIDVLDISKLATMDQATKVKAIPLGVTYEVKGTVADAGKFYRKLLKGQGWKESTSLVEMDNLAVLYFTKSDFLLGLTIRHEKKSNLLEVSLIHQGNVDIRKLPFPADAEIESNRFQHINTTTKFSITEVEAFYQKELPPLGWKLIPRGTGLLRCTQNAIELDIEIQTNSSNQTSIKVSTSMR